MSRMFNTSKQYEVGSKQRANQPPTRQTDGGQAHTDPSTGSGQALTFTTDSPKTQKNQFDRIYRIYQIFLSFLPPACRAYGPEG
jgi:hypothetical protein